MTACEMHELTT